MPSQFRLKHWRVREIRHVHRKTFPLLQEELFVEEMQEAARRHRGKIKRIFVSLGWKYPGDATANQVILDSPASSFSLLRFRQDQPRKQSVRGERANDTRLILVVNSR